MWFTILYLECNTRVKKSRMFYCTFPLRSLAKWKSGWFPPDIWLNSKVSWAILLDLGYEPRDLVPVEPCRPYLRKQNTGEQSTTSFSPVGFGRYSHAMVFITFFKGEKIVTQGNSAHKRSELYWLPHRRTFKSQTPRDENVCSHVWSCKLVHTSGVHCRMHAYIHAYISIYMLIYRWLYNLAEIGRENARADIYNWSGSFGEGGDGEDCWGSL